MSHRPHGVVRLVAVQRPIARRVRDELEGAHATDRHVGGHFRPLRRFGDPAPVGSRDLELVAVQMDRMARHAEVSDPDPDAVALPDDQRIDAGEDAAVERPDVEIEHGRRVRRVSPRVDVPAVHEERKIPVHPPEVGVFRMDDEKPHHAHRHLHHLVGVRVIHVRSSGTHMYHPHADEMVQMAMGMMGLFIIHPKNPNFRRVDRDFAFLVNGWDIDPGTYTPNTATMLDFNIWTFNSRVFPGIDPLVVRKGDRVRVRVGNLSMTSHPIHLHGYEFKVTGTDGGWIPESAQWPEVTTDVPVGGMRSFEFVADAPGDWALH